MKTATVPDLTVVHDTFQIERMYRQAPAKVFAAFADAATKRRWFAEGEGFEIRDYSLDFRVGGRERADFTFLGGPAGAPSAGTPMRNETIYLDIVADQRIVFAYSMIVGEAPMSASLGTVELVSAGGGTRLTYTEQAAFFENADGTEMRTRGWRGLLEALGRELDRAR
jgi:uncharacterized protein YndB with AHSA1/START domain